jgi:hypothetical protein
MHSVLVAVGLVVGASAGGLLSVEEALATDAGHSQKEHLGLQFASLRILWKIRAKIFKLCSHEHTKNRSVFLHPSEFFGDNAMEKNRTDR